MKKALVISILLTAGGAFAKPACYSFKASKGEFPAPIQEIVLKADTELVSTFFDLTGLDASGKDVASAAYRCVTSTPERSSCDQDDDVGSFQILWGKTVQLKSKRFSLGDDEDQPIEIKAPLPKKAKDEEAEPLEYTLIGKARPCLPEKKNPAAP